MRKQLILKNRRILKLTGFNVDLTEQNFNPGTFAGPVNQKLGTWLEFFDKKGMEVSNISLSWGKTSHKTLQKLRPGQTD